MTTMPAKPALAYQRERWAVTVSYPCAFVGGPRDYWELRSTCTAVP